MTLVETLEGNERAWNERPLFRSLYREWLELVTARLSAEAGPTIELGSGLGNLLEAVPEAVATDVEPTPWATAVVDAQDMPYRDTSIANLVLIDVFHHIPRPARFLDEADRVLVRGGRVVMLEPYWSRVSGLAYRRFHDEPVDLATDPFTDVDHSSNDPVASNSVLPTLAFFRHVDEFERRWPGLRLVERRRLSYVAYPLSGGFSRKPLVPAAALGALRMAERALSPLSSLLAFRCLVVLERS